MQRLFIFGFILLLMNSGFSQSKSMTVPFVSYWALGDTYNFKVSKINEQWKEDKLIKIDTTAYLANFEVIDSTENSYKIKWSFQTQLVNNIELSDRVLEKLAKYQMTHVIYRTSELGAFIEIENWQEISTMMQSLLKDLSDAMAADGLAQKEAIDQAFQPLITVYSSKEGIEQVVFKEIHHFHFPFGSEFKVKKTLKYKDLLPNLIGGEPLKANGKIYFKEVDFDENYCVLIQELQINPKDSKRLISEFLGQMKLEKGNEMAQIINTGKVDVRDYNRYAFYYDPGVPVEIDAQRETLIDLGKGKGRKVEKIRIELVE